MLDNTFLLTFSAIITSPRYFFYKIILNKNTKSSLFFGIKILVIVLSWNMLRLTFLDWHNMENKLSALGIATNKIEFLISSFLALLLISFFYIIFSYFLSYALYNLVKIRKGIFGKDNFNTIFKIVNYSFVAAVFSILPLAGFFIAISWYLVLVCIGITGIYNNAQLQW